MWSDAPIGEAEFAALAGRLGPFEPAARIAVAVSGGPDSMALALLAADWATVPILALVVDHGLRAASAAEARLTCERLGSVGIGSRLLTLDDVGPGGARARRARYLALELACARAGILHLLLGHHAADQAETVLIRMLAGSAARGLSGMAAIVETANVRLLRPLLATPPVRLRATVRARGLGWVEDPSNHDRSALRARLRALRRDADGTGPSTAALVRAAVARGQTRATAEVAGAQILARRVRIYPEGFAVVTLGPLPASALGALLATIAGGALPPSLAQVAPLASSMRACTIGGVRILPAGRLGPGWLLVREAVAMGPPVSAGPGVTWDHRFRLPADIDIPDGLTLGAAGNDARARRGPAPLPAAVAVGMPMLRNTQAQAAEAIAEAIIDAPLFAPPNPVSPAPFGVI